MKESKEIPHLELAYDIGVIYEAGSNTTTMNLEVFTMAAITQPGFVTKAQEELDAIFGGERLPKYSDKLNLPYISAMVSEVLRWRPVAAGGIPYALIHDDEYMGYRLHQGATIIGDHWAIHLDESITRMRQPSAQTEVSKTQICRLASLGVTVAFARGNTLRKPGSS